MQYFFKKSVDNIPIMSYPINRIKKGGNKMLNKNKFLGKMVEAGYNQTTLSEELGISKNTLGAWVNNKRPIDANQILNLCAKLNIKNDHEKVEIFLSNVS